MFADVFSGGIHSGMVCPLVQHVCMDFFMHFTAYNVFRNQCHVKACDKFINAVIYLRIGMVGATCKHNNLFALFLCTLDNFITVITDFLQIAFIFAVSSFCGGFHFFQRNAVKVIFKLFIYFFRKVFWAVNADKFMEQFHALNILCIRINDFGIVGDDGTIIMIVA